MLLQHGKPIVYSSTSLSLTLNMNFQIEKELLAVQFGLMWFKQYIYGQMVVVEFDHNQLVGLLDKPIASCSPKIQRMPLQLQRFDFKLVYKHKPRQGVVYSQHTKSSSVIPPIQW